MQYKTELHAHCSEVSPCADLSATQVVDRYIRAGYHSLVLTNHLTTPILSGRGNTWDEAIDFFLSPLKIMQEHGNGKLNILLGAEIRFDSHANDYLLYGLTEEFLRTHPNMQQMRLKDFILLARENGVLVIQAHPFRNGMTVVRPEHVDGYEVFNAHPGHNSRNAFADSWAKMQGLLRTSGSDFHHPHSVEAGGILTDCPITDTKQLADVIRRANCTLLCGGPWAERDGMTDMPAKY